MATGKKAFAGNTQASLFAAILERDPLPIVATPPLFEHVVRTCLAKDPDERWQSAADVKRALQWVSASGGVETGRTRGWGDSRPLIPWIVCSLIAGGVATALVFLLAGPRIPRSLLASTGMPDDTLAPCLRSRRAT